MRDRLNAALKRRLVPLIYRYPPSELLPERLGVFLSGLVDRAHLSGDVAEIGCNLGGTTVLASTALRRMGWTGNYVCYDTFGGFVKKQFDVDIGLGTPRSRSRMYAANSVDLVRAVLRYHGCADVRLVKGDVTATSPRDLSPSYSAVLLDIDLSEPTYAALGMFWPRVCSGGVIYVDDCPEGSNWKARVGYERFCAEHGLPTTYRAGLGILYKE
jgi:O-methyltransferase